MSLAAAGKSRIVSLDQFRGYTVAGMCLVNFLAPFAAVPALLKHNESWFSYADSIMPSFFFVVGYSFRLTYLRRRTSTTRFQTAKTYLRRSLVLFALSFLIYGLTAEWSHWFESERMPPEFQSARTMPAATRSFELLIERARQKAPQAQSQTALASAAEIGALVDSPEPADAARRADYVAAQQAARTARDEGNQFLQPANARVRAWHALGSTGRMFVNARIQAGRLFKADLWETLAIIAAAQLLVLPWVGVRPAFRIAVLIAYAGLHWALCAWFNWDFVYGINNNWMSRLWMTGDCRSWDGGVFGPLSWSIPILVGTLAYDLTANTTSRRASARRLLLFGGGFLVFGYTLACLTRLYDFEGPELTAIRERRLLQNTERDWLDNLIGGYEQRLQSRAKSAQSDESAVELEARIAVLRDQRAAYPDLDLAPHQFLPNWSRARDRSLSGLLAEPPFVAPPADDVQSAEPRIEHRLWNYWMLGKRGPTLSFMTLASGFACVLYSLFVIGCDGLGWKLGLFRTFGTNALVAYFVHGMFTLAVWPFVAKDAGLPIALAAFAVFFTLTYLLVRQLEKRSIYIKL